MSDFKVMRKQWQPGSRPGFAGGAYQLSRGLCGSPSNLVRERVRAVSSVKKVVWGPR